MAYKLIITKSDRVVREHVLQPGQTSIGRRQHNVIRLDDPTVSGKHALIRVEEDRIDIEDLGSTNGTYLNGDLLDKQQRMELQLGDRLVVGPYRIAVQLNMDDAWSEPGFTPTPVQGRSDFNETARAELTVDGRVAALEITSGVNAGRTLPLTKVVTTVGTPGVGILALTHRINTYVVSKVEGEQPITVNDAAIDPAGTTVRDGDRIAMGGIQMVFRLLPR